MVWSSRVHSGGLWSPYGCIPRQGPQAHANDRATSMATVPQSARRSDLVLLQASHESERRLHDADNLHQELASRWVQRILVVFFDRGHSGNDAGLGAVEQAHHESGVFHVGHAPVHSEMRADIHLV